VSLGFFGPRSALAGLVKTASNMVEFSCYFGFSNKNSVQCLMLDSNLQPLLGIHGVSGDVMVGGESHTCRFEGP
jgi:hypothetical protein